LNTDAVKELDSLVASLVGSIAKNIAQDDGNQIAHVKASILAGDAQSVANVVSNDTEVDMGLMSGRSASGSFQVIVNARVAMDPDVLERICRENVLSLSEANGMTLESIQAQSLRPGRPEPTHRITRA
jgi:hypothetical protein